MIAVLGFAAVMFVVLLVVCAVGMVVIYGVGRVLDDRRLLRQVEREQRLRAARRRALGTLR